jgi:polyphosphate kinase
MTFDKAEYFLSRELSWLKFNTRVLNEAADTKKPLLERLRFISITSSNLDEFFMIRAAGLDHQLETGVSKMDAAGFTVEQQLQKIAGACHELVKKEYRYLKRILQAMTAEGIQFVAVEDLNSQGREWVENYFYNTVFPVLTPLGVDASHPFPFLYSRTLNLAVMLLRQKEAELAVVPVPGVLPRIVEVPGSGGEKRFVFLEDIIKTYCKALFRGYEINGMVDFRITRNADMFIDEEEAEDLLVEVEKSLRQRKWGQAVRLEINKFANKALKKLLLKELGIGEQDVYEIQGPLDATCFMKFADIAGYDHLRYTPFVPQRPLDLKDKEDIFAAIADNDILLHHPYESFEPVVEFVQRAASDPRVLAIKQTLYRVSGNSPIVKALAQAAENGKQVTVVVELKARFDEENNIQWARKLEEAGCHVIYGLVGLKTHAKMILVVRQDEDGIKRYVHMGTGNYNDATARVYTDLGLFTANDQFGADASAFFNTLSGYSDPPIWNKLVVAPLGLREKIKELIDGEIAHAVEGRPARIIAKMNSLLDKDIIVKLYEASQHGVKIDLIVRGICSLKPGIENVSGNIAVRSIVGRFLEHHRIYYFFNDGDEKVFLSSADLMPRNLNERVELLFPVENERHVERIKDMLTLFLSDNQKAYVMKNDGAYRRVDKRGKAVNSQEEFYRRAQRNARPERISLEQKLKPLYRKDL